jgi:hypothetical protein
VISTSVGMDNDDEVPPSFVILLILKKKDGLYRTWELLRG